MRRVFSRVMILTALTASACTQTGQDAPPSASASAVAPQTSGSIQVYDLMAPGNRRTVSPNWAVITAQPLGSKENPVRTFMPQGQQAYLMRLVCPDGSTPSFRRIGNFGAGVYTTIIDGYDVRCGSAAQTIYLDMYHPNYMEQRAVSGFTIRPASSTRPASAAASS